MALPAEGLKEQHPKDHAQPIAGTKRKYRAFPLGSSPMYDANKTIYPIDG